MTPPAPVVRGSTMSGLREHSVVLQGETHEGVAVRLRPMTESDWDVLVKWNNDPKVLYYAEGDEVDSRSIDEVQDIYRSTSRRAFCFIIEAG